MNDGFRAPRTRLPGLGADALQLADEGGQLNSASFQPRPRLVTASRSGSVA
jgi:hypothetical protein